MKDNTIKILLVEDDDVDAMAIGRGFEKEKIANRILRVKDGIEALAALRAKAVDEEALEKPYVVFLDLNMPRMDGFEFLTALRADAALQETVVFVLTTSNREEDRVRAYGHNVSGYISKGEAGRDFINVIRMIDHYWRVVELP